MSFANLSSLPAGLGVIGKNSLHAVCGFALQGGENMTVGAHRQADLTVAERFHNHTRMHALDQQQ